MDGCVTDKHRLEGSAPKRICSSRVICPSGSYSADPSAQSVVLWRYCQRSLSLTSRPVHFNLGAMPLVVLRPKACLGLNRTQAGGIRTLGKGGPERGSAAIPSCALASSHSSSSHLTLLSRMPCPLLHLPSLHFTIYSS
jgi:hypothetical protein